MPRLGSTLDLDDGDDISQRPSIVTADSRRGTMSDPPPNGGPPPALLEQLPDEQSRKATRQLDVRSSDGISAPPSSEHSPELSATVTDSESDTGPEISIQEEQKASQNIQHSPRPYNGSTNSRSDTETNIRNPPADAEEQEASHNRTKIALLDVHKRKQEIEQQLRRVQMGHGQSLQDNTAGHQTLEQKLQGLVTQGEEQEAAHNQTRIALVKAHKEKHDAEQKLNRAVTQYRQKLQAVGIMAEDDAQPVWEVDSDGRQTRPLYKDFPNMFRESHVNLLINRANCRFMLGDYQGMATIAFGALEVSERLKFRPLSARCQFIIGISFYHSGRFHEAQHRFRLALDCKDRYGISTECVERWLEKCENGVAGNASAIAQSPIRDRYPRDTDRAVETRFRADVFFARATNSAGSLGSPDVEGDEDVEVVEGYTFCPSQGYDDESDEAEEVSTPSADEPRELLPAAEQSIPLISPTRPPSQDIGQAKNATEQTGWVNIPTIRSSDQASVPLSQSAPYAIENSVAEPTSRPRSSTSVDPRPVESSYAPFSFAEQNPVKVRGRAVTHVQQKGAKGSTTGRLLGPLSWLTKDMENVPIQDIEAWANRPLEKRLQEAAKDQRQARFPVAFILYRSAYADRIRNLYKGADHQFVSTIASESWKMELPKIREQYEEWAALERVHHEEAFRKITT